MKPQPRACFRCLVVKEPEAFAWGDGARGKGTYRRRKAVCLECEAKAAAEKAAKAERRKKTWMEDGRWVRKCRLCGEVKDLKTEFYRSRGLDKMTGNLSQDYQYDCARCQAQRVDEYQREMRKLDPSFTAKRTEQQKRWRHANNEQYRKQKRRYRQRVMQDPERHEAAKELRRIEHRLRRERAGGSFAEMVTQPVQIGSKRQHLTYVARQFIPAAPLIAVIRERLDRHDGPEVALLHQFGIEERQWRRWESGETRGVYFHDADRALIGLDLLWFDVWTEDAEGYEEARRLFEGEEDVAA